MVCFVPSPPTISSTHPIHPNRSQPFLHSCQILTLHQEWTWLGLCAPWFASSHLPPPSHSLTHSTPTGLRQCFTCIKSLPCISLSDHFFSHTESFWVWRHSGRA